MHKRKEKNKTNSNIPFYFWCRIILFLLCSYFKSWQTHFQTVRRVCWTGVAAVNTSGNSKWPFVFQRMNVASQHGGHVGFVRAAMGSKQLPFLLKLFIRWLGWNLYRSLIRKLIFQHKFFCNLIWYPCDKWCKVALHLWLFFFNIYIYQQTLD